MGMRFRLLDRSLAFKSDLARPFGKHFNEVLNDVGSGEFSVMLNDADAALVDYDDIVQCFIEDDVNPAFSWEVESLDFVVVTREGKSGKALKASGRGVGRLAEDQIVYPEFSQLYAPSAVYRKTPPARQFGWMSATFNQDLDTPWELATVVQTGTSTDGPFPGAPKGWPDPAAAWLWAGPGTGPNRGVYWQQSFELTAEQAGRYAVFISAADGYDLWVDGSRVSQEVSADIWKTMRRSEIEMDVGSHTVAVHAFKLDTGLSNASGGFILSILKLSEGGNKLGSVITRTDPTSFVHAPVGDRGPGITVGFAMWVLLLEGSGRTGAVNLLDDSWNFTHDTEGVDWDLTDSVGVQVGQDYLSVLRQLSELYFDWDADPLTRKIRLYVEKGTDRSGSVSLTPAVNISEATHHNTAPIANVLLSQFDKGWTEDSDSGSITAWGRKEAFLQLETQSSRSYVSQVAAGELGTKAVPKRAITVAMEIPLGGPRPYQDLFVGDWVMAPDETGSPERVRVRGMTVSEDDAGALSFVPEVGSIQSEWELRTHRWLKRISPGHLAGQTEQASDQSQNDLTQFENVETPRALQDATDVANIDPTDKQLLSYDETAGEYTPRDVPIEDLSNVANLDDPGGTPAADDVLTWNPDGGPEGTGQYEPKPGGGGGEAADFPPFGFATAADFFTTVRWYTGDRSLARVEASLQVPGENETVIYVRANGHPIAGGPHVTIPAGEFHAESTIDWTYNSGDYIDFSGTMGIGAHDLSIQPHAA